MNVYFTIPIPFTANPEAFLLTFTFSIRSKRTKCEWSFDMQQDAPVSIQIESECLDLLWFAKCIEKPKNLHCLWLFMDNLVHLKQEII